MKIIGEQGGVKMCKQVNDLYERAFQKMREASMQDHHNHFDWQGTFGANCPECIRSRKLRKEADEIFSRAQKLANQVRG